MRLARLTLLGTTAAAAGLIMAGPAAAVTLGGFGARPAHFDAGNPATRAYFIHRLDRGARFADQIVVFNSQATPMRLRVYPVDGLTGATSGVVYGNRGTPLRSAGAWVTVDAAQITVPAHGQTRVGFTATAPATAASGVHLAGLALEQADPTTSGGQFQVTEVLRTVVGIEMIVPGANRPQIALSSIRPTTVANTAAAVAITLANVGRGLCKPQLTLALVGAGGRRQVTRQLDTLLPGDSIPYVVAWPHPLVSGPYDATVSANRCGTPRVLRGPTAIGHLRPPAWTTADRPPAVAIATGAATLPWPVIALAGIGGVVIGLILSRGRRRGRATA